MLKLKHHELPKYLQKRKIQHIREKIIKRKYAYLFYYKTASQILPSVAKLYYLHRLKKKSLKKLRQFVYERKIAWRHTMRAELHHSYNLKTKIIKSWVSYVVERKTCRIKEKISEVMFQKNEKKINLKYCFIKWRKFIAVQKENEFKEDVAKAHYKSKHSVVELKPYFKRWKQYTIFTIKMQQKLFNAQNYYKTKLQTRVLNFLGNYVKYRNFKTEQKEKAANYFINRLKRSCFFKLLSYKLYKINKNQKFVMAKEHYEFKLKQIHFNFLYKNKERRLFKLNALIKFAEMQRFSKKLFSFKKFQRYASYKKVKFNKLNLCVNFYNKNLLGKLFKLWKSYCVKDFNKRLLENSIIIKLNAKINTRSLRVHLKAWKNYLEWKKNCDKIVLQFRREMETKLLFEAIQNWKIFVSIKKRKQVNEFIALKFYHSLLLRKKFNLWKIYHQKEKKYMVLIKEAQDYYRKNLLKEFLSFIFEMGTRRRFESLQLFLSLSKRRFELYEKYFFIWKSKTLYKNCNALGFTNTNDFHTDSCVSFKRREFEEGGGFQRDILQPFRFNPECLQPPKVPQFFKQYIKDILE